MAFESIMRVYFLARPQTQAQVMRFYGRVLGRGWRRRGPTCHVSRSRLVATVVYPANRRLGVMFDAKAAHLCGDISALMSDLLEIGTFPRD